MKRIEYPNVAHNPMRSLNEQNRCATYRLKDALANTNPKLLHDLIIT